MGWDQKERLAVADATIKIDVEVSPPDPLASLVKQTKDAESAAGGLESQFGKVGKALAGLATLGALKGAFDFVVDATRQFEDLTTQLQGFTGSTESAAAQLEALSGIPGPSLPELVAADKALLSFGVSASKTVGQLTQLNDVAIGSGAKIGDLAEIFGKVQEEGNLTAETFSKLSKQIPGFATTFAEAIGVPRAAFKALAADGKISADQITSALSKITGEGGKYFEQAAKQSQTLSGALDELSDAATAFGASLGSSAVPGLASLINLTTKAIEGNRQLNLEQQKIANENESQKRIRAIGAEVEALTEKLKDLQDQQKGGFSFFGDDALKVASDIDVVSTSIRALGLERLKLLKSEGTADLAKQVEAENKLAEAAKQKADDDKLAKLLEQQALEAEAVKKAAEEKQKKIQESEAKITEIAFQEAAVRQQILAEQDIIGSEQKLLVLQEREAELTAARLQAEATRLDLLTQYDNAELIRAQDKQNKLTEITNVGEAKRKAEIKKAKDDEFNITKANTEAVKKFEEQTYTQRVDTARTGLSAIAALQKSGSRDAFNIGKRAAQAQVLLDIPKAAFAAYTSLIGTPFVGPILAPLAAAAAVFAGQQQLRQIESAQPPGFAEGGLVPGIGNKDTVPALLTPGEVVVPKKNYADLSSDMVRGAIADDQVILLQQGNAISSKILDQLTIGVINEKLTIMVKLLDDVVSGLDKVALAAASSNTPEAVAPVIAEIEQNKPSGYGEEKRTSRGVETRRPPQITR
jgi:tape measure domain-containing protein